MKKVKEIIPYIIIIITVVLIRTYIITPIKVIGVSMYPTLKPNDIMLLYKYNKIIKRFDIVVIKRKNDSPIIKRVIGLPGENVYYENNKLYINNKQVKENFTKEQIEDFYLEQLDYKKIPKDKYFVIGDNRDQSLDSRKIGLISKKQILGTTNIVIFPLNNIGQVK
jgi:signal peptidase I